MKRKVFLRRASLATALFITGAFSVVSVSAGGPNIGAPEIPVAAGGGGSSTPTPTPVGPPPTPSCVDPTSPACGGSGPSCPVYAKIAFTDSGGYGSKVVYTNVTPLVKYTGATPACIKTFIEKAVSDAWKKESYNRYFDDWVYQRLFINAGIDPHDWNHGLVDCQKIGPASFGHYTDMCIRGQIYFNVNTCKPALFADVKAACPNVAVAVKNTFYPSSPVSLLWSDDADVESELAFVRFPLDPRHPDNWYVWKASAKAPLVVYDPEHAGRIDSASQLFGHWTFGGKKLAAQNIAPEMLGAGETPWKDGYEALASLDADRDGELSGAELAPLGLWFDRNQDAVSQPGEVKSLSEAGVTKLFVTADGSDPVSGNIFASRGFERASPSGRIRGGSVDWFSKGASTPFELYAIYGLKALAKAPGATPEIASPAEGPALAFDELAANPSGAGVSGAWEWSFNDPQANRVKETQGYLVIAEERNGNRFFGATVTELPMESPDRSLGSAAQFALFEGSKGIASGSTVEYRFETVEVGSEKTESTFRLSEDGSALDGATVQTLQRNGKAITLRYGWTARRVGG